MSQMPSQNEYIQEISSKSNKERLLKKQGEWFGGKGGIWGIRGKFLKKIANVTNDIPK